MFRRAPLLVLLALAAPGCKKSDTSSPEKAPAPEPSALKIGLVTDVGGRGDQSFNDGALRGLETWAAGVRYATQGYQTLKKEEIQAAVPADVQKLRTIAPLGVRPVVLQAKQQEDYAPNLELLIEDGASLAIGVGFMLENAVEQAAKKHPDARFLLIDSPILAPQGTPAAMPNVKPLTFREQEGAFLVGALAGMVTKTGVVGFVGGMQIPLIRRFEAGFRAGVAATNPDAAGKVLVGYTGSFDRVEAGKQVAQDMIAKNADVIFHAAGADGLGAIAAAQEAGRWAIGCDSDQHHVAPGAMLTSLIKRVDLAVYLAVDEIVAGKFASGHRDLGLKEGALGWAPLRSEKLENREQLTARLEALREQVVSGAVQVPATLEALATFSPPAATP